ncbi:MAG: DNA/RNA non-specific endonuclease [Sphaerochaetaceae bacterium]|nr:DNA/RNA non-specific endonuclease [Sphaerochaetaceae bacterium]
MKKKRTNTKKHSKLKKLLLTLLILSAILLVAILLTPDGPVTAEAAPSQQGQIIEGLEIPKSDFNGQIVKHTGYTLCYSETDEQPYWVAYTLTKDKINGSISRQDNFRPDPAITTQSAALSDYRGSGYDRGHLIPAADLCYSTEAMDDSFFLSNMSPQAPQFNRGIWADLEATVRNFAENEEVIYVVTGPILTDGPYETIGKNEVSIPKYYYKAILDYSEPELKAIGFILPNEESNADIKSFALTIDDVEKMSGIDFFPLLNDADENKIEASVDTALWDFEKFYRSSGSVGDTAAEPNDSATSEVSIKADIIVTIQNILYDIFGELRKEILSFLK